MVKFGFVGFEKSKPKIINVAEATFKNLENNITFKES